MSDTHWNPAADGARLSGRWPRGMLPWACLVLLGVSRAASFEVARPGNRLCYYLSPVDGSRQPYHVYIPDSYDPERPTPVVFSLHGFGGRTGPAAGGWRARWADAYTWLMIRPDGRGNQNWDGIGEDDIFCIIRDLGEATAYHPALHIDTKRLYAEGGSMGGHGCFRLATRHPGTFAAVAPVAGWTKFEEFLPHWYDAADKPRFPDYVDPARRAVLETASSLRQAENARSSWMYITYDTNDSINPLHNATDMDKAVRKAGGVRVGTRVGARGHCGSYSSEHNYRFFRDKTVDEWPRTVSYTTNTVRHNRGHWVTVNRLHVQNRWARVEAHVEGQEIVVKTRNLLGFSLDLSERLLDMAEPVTIRIDDAPSILTAAQPRLTLTAALDEDSAVGGWELQSGEGLEAASAAVRKTHALPGPLDDAFRSRFVLIHGAQPGSRRGRSGTDLRDAQQFAAEWNSWMTLHWGGQRPPRHRRNDWQRPPYPFRSARDVHPEQELVVSFPDTDFTLSTIPRDRNLILFGDPSSNWIIAQLAAQLPLKLAQALPGVRIQCGRRVYEGEHVNYLFIAPNPLAPTHYVVVSRGYLSSKVDPNQHGAGKVGKDLEALPFYWPDYVIWDGRRTGGRTVQDPFRYLPDTFLEAGFFGEDWQLRVQPPRVSVKVQGTRLRSGAYGSPVKVEVVARDAVGGFGSGGVEYRAGDGPWTPYRGPFTVRGEGSVEVAARAASEAGQYVYRPAGNGARGAPVAGMLSAAEMIVLELQQPRPGLGRVGEWFGGVFGRRNRDEKSK